jgi:hypothetical protein
LEFWTLEPPRLTGIEWDQVFLRRNQPLLSLGLWDILNDYNAFIAYLTGAEYNLFAHGPAFDRGCSVVDHPVSLEGQFNVRQPR